jgi:uncharacterized protein (TIRG00374 family)
VWIIGNLESPLRRIDEDRLAILVLEDHYCLELNSYDCRIRVSVIPLLPLKDGVPSVPRFCGSRVQKTLSISIRFAIGIVLLIVVFRFADIDAVFVNLASINPFWVTVLCVIGIMDRVLMAYKWNLLLRARGIFISEWQATRLYFVGCFFGAFTPGAVGKDIYRIAALSSFQKKQLITSTILLERIIGFAVICTLALLTLPFSMKYIKIPSTLIVGVVTACIILTIALLYISFQPEMIRGIARRVPQLSQFVLLTKIKEFYLVFVEHRFHKKIVLFVVLLTTFEVIVMITISFLAAKSTGISVSFVYMFCTMPLLHVLISLPISVQAIGIQEGLFVYFLGNAGFSAAEGLSVSILLRLAHVVLISLPAILMLLIGPIRLPKSS